jgi:hypothetical protein
MRQAIVTKFHGPTDHRGARVKATADAGSITLPWDHALWVEDNHRTAAIALARKLGWCEREDQWVGGSTPGAGFAFVLLPV